MFPFKFRCFSPSLLFGRNLRLQVISEEGGDVDLGPGYDEFKWTDPEFTSAHQKEIERLKDDLDRTERQIESLQFGVRNNP